MKGVTLIDRSFVNPQLGMILDYPANPINGILYRGNEHIIEVGEPNDLGLLRICGKHAIWKQYSYTDWSRLSEKYGIPLLLLFLDSTDEAEITATLEAMRNIGSNGVGNLSATDKAQFLEMSGTDPYKIFQEADNMHSNKISKIITGQSDATNSNSSGSFARAETHLSILNDRVRADMRRISYLVNDSLFPMLIRKSPKYKGLANHKFVYKSIEDEKLLKSHTIQSTLNPKPLSCPEID
jgi:phage gp29-like protein